MEKSNNINREQKLSEIRERKKRIHPVRLLWRTAKKCKFDKILTGFLIVFLLTSLAVFVTEPDVKTFREGIWYTFVACTTIGFGDIAPTTFIGRFMTIIVTIYEIIVVALISGVFVSYYLELIHRTEKEVLASFVDRLEHLSELDRDELREMEEQVREFMK